MELYEREE